MVRLEQAPVADARGGLLDGEDLGVRRRRLAQLALVVGRGDDLAVAHDDGPHGDVVVRDGPRRLAQRQAHEVLVVGQLVHGRSSPVVSSSSSSSPTITSSSRAAAHGRLELGRLACTLARARMLSRRARYPPSPRAVSSIAQPPPHRIERRPSHAELSTGGGPARQRAAGVRVCATCTSLRTRSPAAGASPSRAGRTPCSNRPRSAWLFCCAPRATCTSPARAT